MFQNRQQSVNDLLTDSETLRLLVVLLALDSACALNTGRHRTCETRQIAGKEVGRLEPEAKAATRKRVAAK